ncbi:MAG: beta-propeller fold lactonase family protein [Gallionella sp.]
MRFSPTKLLHGLLYTAPVMLLTLVACGGGGSPAPLDVYYTVSGTTSGLTSAGLVLRNNGGDDQPVTGDPTGITGFTFPAINTSYNVTVLEQPDHRNCIVSNGSGPRMSVNVTDVAVSCVDAFVIGGSISGVPGTGLVLQNNGGDNLQVASGVPSYAFSTPLAANDPYAVTIISQPYGQDCSFDPSSVDPSSGVVGTSDIFVDIVCSNTPPPLPEDRHVYTADLGANTVSAYQASSGALTAPTAATAGTGPTSVAVDPAGQFAYVTNQTDNTVSAYTIGGTGALTPLADVDAGTTGPQSSIATGTTPVKIAIHPSGKFAYVVNKISNRISAYSIDTDPNSVTFGALARIDTDGGAAGNQTTIPTRLTPVAIAIHPDGEFAYVANASDGNGSVSVYSIDIVSGALTAIDATGSSGNTYLATGGTTPFSLKVDPAGQYLYVANRNTSDVSIFAIGVAGAGTLSTLNVQFVTDGGATDPVAIALHPTKQFAYVVNSGNSKVNVYSTAINGWGTIQSSAATGSLPISISIDRSGQYAYVANSGDSTISAYSINPATGALTEDTDSPFTAGVGTAPNSVTTAP